MKSKQRILWELAQSIIETHGEFIDNIHIYEMETEEHESHIRIYVSDGYCFDLYKHGLPDNETDIKSIEEGYVYNFDEMWDGFEEVGIDKAIEILREYGKEVQP